MAVFMVRSKCGEHPVYVSDKDAKRVRNYARFDDERRVKDYVSANDKRDENGFLLHPPDYSRPLSVWHILWKEGRISAVFTSIYTGPKLGTKSGRRTKQVKLHEFIMGDIPNCKGVKFKDGNPLNNTRENLVVYQIYETEVLCYETKGRKRTDICVGCVDDKTCGRVPTRKRLLSVTEGSGRSV